MSTTEQRDGLARAIRDAYAADIIPADTLMSDEGWSGLVGSVEEWHPEADAALAYLAGQRVDVEVVARVLRAHDAEMMSCADHDRYCCPAGDAHDFRSPYRHQAEMIAALTPDVSNPADAVLPYDGPDFDLVMAGHDLSLVPHWPGPGKWCEACPTPVPATADAWDEGYVPAQENHDCNGRSAPAVNPYRPTVDGAR